MKPFHQWKDEVVKKEGFRRDKYWYYSKYGQYVLSERRKTQ